jgi:hypothetical protein
LIGKKVFLISAAHVLDSAMEGQLYIGTPTGFVEVHGEGIATKAPDGDREKDHVDIGLTCISDQTAAFLQTTYRFLPMSWVQTDDVRSPRARYRVHGYPWRKVKKEGQVHCPEMFTFQLVSIPGDRYGDLGLSPVTHLALELQRSKILNSEGREIIAPRPKGMSGSPVWKVVNVPGVGQKSMLVGVLIEFREWKKALVVTNIVVPLEATRREFPALGGHIPESGAAVPSVPLFVPLSL